MLIAMSSFVQRDAGQSGNLLAFEREREGDVQGGTQLNEPP